MPVQRLGHYTMSVDSLNWNGLGFEPAEAQSIWLQMPEILKQIALAEMQAGNNPKHILHNEKQDVFLLAFQDKPMAELHNDELIRVHSSFAYGNYCYDGTFCTYEDIESGSFLAFIDPTYDYNAL